MGQARKVGVTVSQGLLANMVSEPLCEVHRADIRTAVLEMKKLRYRWFQRLA